MSKNNASRNFLIWSEIDLVQLRKNLRTIRSCLRHPNVEILAVVKADAYGHGMRPVASELARRGVGFFGVANIEEAVELRQVCPVQRILVLGSFHESQIPRYFRYKVTPTIFSLEDVELLGAYRPRREKVFPVHVKVDTGMGRLGVWHEEAEAFFKRIRKKSFITVEGIYTHFSSADQKDKAFTLRQLALFEAVVEKAKTLGISPRYFHAANSIGLMRFKNSHLNLVRPGIVLYGIVPFSGRGFPSGIRPILSLKTRISFLKDVEKGRVISYGATYRTASKTRIATLPIGYSHGYRVGFSNKAFMVVRGQKCPVVGRVTMDQTLIDVGKVRSVKRWDEVTVIGSDGKNQVMAQDLADVINSIPYEIVCSIHSRIPRVYEGF